ncbi:MULTISPECIES: NAD-dependent epimerase/dehydratase family protein [unclassified Streptomyces]|uniref:NAD-dependent epimerase/dehydratase family protein n=1 Tax=unclassified Streptomyces TaxID=2593676 RepID=UPI000BCE96FF|nr:MULTISPECIES: NAD(P)-dependent oxidoreductase [unclassified Streptomyces]SOB78843.1 Nucleoside-diphosphate-sugar epimerase [Streptomyces sp. 1331.2]
MARILVTGGTGSVGSRLVPRLVRWAGEQGSSVRVLVRDEAKAAAAARLGVEVVVGDLCEEADRARALHGADVVVNVAAALRGVPDETAWAVNRDAAVALGREAAKAGVARFVHTSTNLVYGRGLGRPAVEGDRPAPDPAWGAYAASKAAAETGLRALEAEAALPLVVVRLAFVYGQGDPHLAQSLQWAAHWPPHQRLAVVHHADVAQALWRAATAPGIEGRTYNVADDAPLTAWDLHVLNDRTHPGGSSQTTFDPWEGQVSTAAARRDLGWRPLYPSAWTAAEAGAL